MARFLLLSLPLIEIAVFVLVGSAIGVLATLALVVASSALGLVLLRTQGVGALARAQTEFRARRDPGPHLVQGAITFVAAVLLLIPGFVTDAIALLLLIPSVRTTAWRLLRGRLPVSTGFASFRHPYGRGFGPGAEDEQTIDLDAADYSRQPQKTSPWRLRPPD